MGKSSVCAVLALLAVLVVAVSFRRHDAYAKQHFWINTLSRQATLGRDSLFNKACSRRIAMSALGMNLGPPMDSDDDEDQIKNVMKFALIADDDARKSWEEFKESKKTEGEDSFGRLLQYNWKYGFCKHYISFEGTETIRRFHFRGDYLAFAMMNGQVALIRLSTGKVLDRFKEHQCEVTSIVFDGTNLVSGGADGKIVSYHLSHGTTNDIKPSSLKQDSDGFSELDTDSSVETIGDTQEQEEKVESWIDENTVSDSLIDEEFIETDLSGGDDAVMELDMNDMTEEILTYDAVDSSRTQAQGKENYSLGGLSRNEMGEAAHHYDSLHSRKVTSIKLCELSLSASSGDKSVTHFTAMFSSGMDSRLNCVNLDAKELVYSIDMQSPPLCMDIVGVASGREIDDDDDEKDNVDLDLEEKKKENGVATYIAVGCLDGYVHVYAGKTGRKLLSFHAHDRVRSIHFVSPSIIVTGGNDGTVIRWDLDAEESSTQSTLPSKDKSNIDTKKTSTGSKPISNNGGRFLDFYFADALTNRLNQPGFIPSGPPKNARAKDKAAAAKNMQAQAKGRIDTERPKGLPSKPKPTPAPVAFKVETVSVPQNLGGGGEKENGGESADSTQVKKKGQGLGVTSTSSGVSLSKSNERKRIYRDIDQPNSPAVSVQADDTKIIAAYEDGTIKSWGVKSMNSLFDLKGRTSLISSVQFDKSRLIADGTHHVIVTHDFGAADAQDVEEAMSASSEGGSALEYDIGQDDDLYEEEEEEDDDDDEEDDDEQEEDDGRPSTTS